MHMQEGMENWVGLLKQITTDRIKPNDDWLIRTGTYLDLYVIGAMRQDMIDFRIARERYKCEIKLIWQEGHTGEVLFELERNLPYRFLTILGYIDKIDFGDFSSVPQELHCYRYRQYMTERERDNMADLDSGIDEFVRLTMIDTETESEFSQAELNIRLKDHMKRTRKSKLTNLRNLRDVVHEQVEAAFPVIEVSSNENVSS